MSPLTPRPLSRLRERGDCDLHPVEQNMPPLLPWMKFLLRFAGAFNLLAGAGMICLYHEGFKLLSVPKPALALPVQVMGILVALFGVGYLLVATNAVENRNLLLLGFLSKALGSVASLWYVAAGRLPLGFAAVVFFADVIYLPPFFLILRRLYRLAQKTVAPIRQRPTDP